MARKAFYSFHYIPDNWRASQVRNMGAIEGNKPTTDNDWESIARGGDEAIKRWINNQMSGCSCAIVLIGAETAGRKWINYEIVKAWDEGKGVLGIYIHHLFNAERRQSLKGLNPFDYITHGATNKPLSTIVQAYDPPFYDGSEVYSHIKNNLDGWVETSIRVRNAN